MFKIKFIFVYFILSILLTPLAYLHSIRNTANETVKTVVTVTMYNAVSTQCDADPNITAAMYKIDVKNASKHRWVAISRNLLKQWGGPFNYGDKILITGAGHKNGIYKIADTMNKRWKNRIDILETHGTKSYKFKNATIQKI